ncbi:MAG: hypothetical protein COB73_00740 [Flavobacteriaceae bacterium]|nr:MAG: hypothetical protein COB73_00740 [Flavobacteriaceae bacterium]
MILAMVARITFLATDNREEIVIRKPNAVKIESSWKMLTDRASIVLPRNVPYFEKHKIKDVFRKGDPVLIELGYNGFLNVEFEGYITRVSANIPITIECEDEMYQLKKILVNLSLPKTSLKALLQQIIPGYDIDALEVEIGAQRFPKTTVAKVLDYLQKDYSLYSYMKGKQIVCGKIYADNSDDEVVKIHLEKNVVSNELNYKHKEDVIIRITAVSTLPDGRKIEVTVGDEDGEERQLSYYGIEIEAELETIAKEDLKKYKVDGFDGSIKLFGDPVIKHGQKVELKSDLYPDRNGTYYVERTKVDFNDTPQFRRTIQLGDKANE